MPHTFTQKLIITLTDWFVAFFGVVLVLWFGFTLPVFSRANSIEDIKTLSINQSDLKNHVEALSNYYAPRTVGFGNLNATAEYIYSEFKKYGNTTYQSYWTLVSDYKNVILELGPKTKEILVIGAHYDAKNDSLDIDGNASGVSALMELAHQLSLNEDKLTIGVQLVAYPLSQKKAAVTENIGSNKHARMLFESGKSVKFMLSLDSVGSFSDADNSQKYPFELLHLIYPDKGNYISLIGRLQDYSTIRQLKKSFKQSSDLPMVSFSMPDSYYPTNSQDHLSYQRYGYPAMVITDTSEHRKITNIEEAVSKRLDYEKIELLIKGLYQVVMDNQSERQSHDIELVQRAFNNDFLKK